MAFKFPYGAMQQLNLDWFIKQFQKLRADWASAEESIAGALQGEIDRAETAMSDVFTARDTAVAAKNDALTAKADALQASANAAQYWQNAANSASAAAGSAGTALQAAEDAETAEANAQTSETNAAASNTQAGVNKFMAEAWAVGTMNGTPVGSGTIQYQNNAKYYAQQASGDAAQTALDRAAVAQDKDDTDAIKDNANAAALRAEGWADGTQNGTPVTSGSPYYENNAKYYKEAAEDVLDSIPPDYSELAAEVSEQSAKIEDVNGVIGYNSITPNSTASSYRLSTTGNAVSASAYKIIKYRVYQGQRLYIVSTIGTNTTDRSFQFQDRESVTTSGNASHIVGTPKDESFFGYVDVPTGATWLIISILKTDTISGVYKSKFGDIEQYHGQLKHLAVGKNIVGSELDVYYPVYLPYGTTVTWAYSDGSVLETTKHIYFYGKNKNYLNYYGFANTGGMTSRTVTLTLSEDVYYILFHHTPTKPMQIEIGSTATEYEPYIDNPVYIKAQLDEFKDSIAKDNYNVFRDKLINAKRKANSGNYNNLTTPDVFTLAHFSDIHNSSTAMKRIQAFKTYFANDLDDMICTGDLVADKISDGISFWTSNSDGSILICIGNHDSLGSGGWSDPEGQGTLYSTYIAPFESNWNAQTVSGHSYWYKDYADKKIRLIALDATIFDSTEQTAQMSWFNDALSGALENSYSVVGAIHFPPMPSNYQKIDCNFSALLHGTSTEMDKYAWATNHEAILTAVDTFINNGGNFVCWVSGHTHWDLVSYDDRHPKQLFVTVSCAMASSTFDERTRSTEESTDLLNVLCVDTARKYVKILRYGAEWDDCLRHIGSCIIKYDANPPAVVYQE